MRLGWKILLPISLGFVILFAAVYYDKVTDEVIAYFDLIEYLKK